MLLARAPVRISFAGGGTDLPHYYTCFGDMVDTAGPLWECERVFGLRGEPFNLLMVTPPLSPEPSRLLRRWAWRLRGTVATSRLGKLPNLLNVLRGLAGPTAGPNGLARREEQAIKDVAYVREYSLWLDLRMVLEAEQAEAVSASVCQEVTTSSPTSRRAAWGCRREQGLSTLAWLAP